MLHVPLLAPAHIDGGVSHPPRGALQTLADAEKVRALTRFEQIRKASSRYHRHEELEINLILKGEGIYTCCGRRFTVRAGSLLWIVPGTEHVDGGDDGGTRSWPSKPIDSPPTYMGSVDNSAACSRQYATIGFEPDDASGGQHPLFLYFVGTAIPGVTDSLSGYDGPATLAVTEAMARRGFVALGVQYDNTFATLQSDHTNLHGCLFGSTNARSLLSAACGMRQVDCDLGIATWGHSLGAGVAELASNYEPRVRAVWAAGYGDRGTAQPSLSRNRFRVVNGEADFAPNNTVTTLNEITGFTSSECPDDGRSECLRGDGSGWILVRQADCQTSTADHCWFENSCFLGGGLEPNWIDPASTKPFALELNADWLAQTLRRP